MSSLQTLKTARLGKGATMDIIVDHSAAEDSVERLTFDTTCDGQPGSFQFSVPLHWHKYHSEQITVLEGKVTVTLDGEAQTVRGGDPTILIPAGHSHSIKDFKGERLVIRERADPPGTYKAEFFNDLLLSGSFPGFWYTMRAFYDGDTYPALPGNVKVLDRAFMLVFSNIARFFAPAKAKL